MGGALGQRGKEKDGAFVDPEDERVVCALVDPKEEVVE